MSPRAVAITGFFLSGIRFLLGFINNAAGSLGLPELGSGALNVAFPHPAPSVWAHHLGQSPSDAAESASFFSPARSVWLGCSRTPQQLYM